MIAVVNATLGLLFKKILEIKMLNKSEIQQTPFMLIQFYDFGVSQN